MNNGPRGVREHHTGSSHMGLIPDHFIHGAAALHGYHVKGKSAIWWRGGKLKFGGVGSNGATKRGFRKKLVFHEWK